MKLLNFSNKWLLSACFAFALAGVALLVTSCAASHEVRWGTRVDPTTAKGGATELTKPVME